MALRLAAPGLAAVALCAWFGGAGGIASLALLVAIVAGATRFIEAVGLAAELRGDRFSVVTASVGLVSLVAAGATHLPLLVLGVFACAAFELLGSEATRAEPAPSESVELLEAPVSRAA